MNFYRFICLLALGLVAFAGAGPSAVAQDKNKGKKPHQRLKVRRALCWFPARGISNAIQGGLSRSWCAKPLRGWCLGRHAKFC